VLKTSSRHFLLASAIALLLLFTVVWSIFVRPKRNEKALARALLHLHEKSFPADPPRAEREVTLTPEDANIPRAILPNRPISFVLTKDKAALLFNEHRFIGVEVISTYVLKRSERDSATWRLSYYSGGLWARPNIVTVTENER
jgi:hypothetical protein